jgi:hypothetical protein
MGAVAAECQFSLPPMSPGKPGKRGQGRCEAVGLGSRMGGS